MDYEKIIDNIFKKEFGESNLTVVDFVRSERYCTISKYLQVQNIAIKECIKQSLPEILQIAADNARSKKLEQSTFAMYNSGKFYTVIDKESITSLEKTIIERMNL